ncbi:Hsp20/alpha crystallin family protein [Haloarchaeobius sp. HME9146]|uniref:Hsp20/alpha crystallin family protein n=1 Tax=Haloarchaeobius sp. HME9146 TaxID=2978732 RepID=UPI0021C1A735|nr:Hsp20/alpha crystallin family protein [Haloarchaeobius sp. HME9146]MCT9095131.1 Hsp20/alpha crystallin family protein [Haloarchaeobius sp. HME9146]
MRRNPFDEIEEMFDRMGRQFEQTGMTSLETVPIDMQDHGDEYEVIADLPGFDSDDIDLTFSEGTLHLDASREEETEEEDEGRYIHRERRESVSRSVRIPEAVDEDAITASYNNGALTVRLPKEEAAGDEGHTIDIN